MTDPLTRGATIGLRWSCCGVLVTEGQHGFGCMNAPTPVGVTADGSIVFSSRHPQPDAMSDERLAEIEARVRAATVDPWEVTAQCEDVILFDVAASTLSWNDETGEYESHSVGQNRGRPLFIANDAFEEDAEFIAHARQDVPDMLAEVRRLRRENHLLRLSQGDLSAVGAD